MGTENLIERISKGDCSIFNVNDQFRYFCEEYVRLQDKQDSLETQLYITAGVIGGVAVILLILIVVLFVKLNNGFKELNEGDMLEKRGFNTYTGRPMHESMNPTFSAPYPPPFPNGKGMNNGNFDNATAGGIKVLPRHPQASILRNNPNDKYY